MTLVAFHVINCSHLASHINLPVLQNSFLRHGVSVSVSVGRERREKREEERQRGISFKFVPGKSGPLLPASKVNVWMMRHRQIPGARKRERERRGSENFYKQKRKNRLSLFRFSSLLSLSSLRFSPLLCDFCILSLSPSTDVCVWFGVAPLTLLHDAFFLSLRLLFSQSP